MAESDDAPAGSEPLTREDMLAMFEQFKADVLNNVDARLSPVHAALGVREGAPGPGTTPRESGPTG